MSETVELLGKIIPNDSADAVRDCIHIAVAPVIASEVLRAGQSVNFVHDSTTHVEGVLPSERIGVVDPYLKEAVAKGQRIFIFLNPGSITSLRHTWIHPAFDTSGDALAAIIRAKTNDSKEIMARSVKWMEDLGERVGFSANDLIKGGHDHLDHGGWLTGGSSMEGERTPEDFWAHFEIITGRKVKVEDRDNFFSCSC